jgi:hypothetical protein
MTTPEPVPDINHSSEASNIFHKFVGGFVINIPCILCEDNKVYIHDCIYDLVDFLDNAELYLHAVKIFNAHLRDSNVTIVFVDLKTGEFIQRSHRLNDDNLPCDWVLMETDLFKPKQKSDELLDFDF